MRSLKYEIPDVLKGTLLDGIVTTKLRDIAATMQRLPAGSIAAALERAPEIRPFRRALTRHIPAVIAELKKASPSAGPLRELFEPASLAREYEQGGAAALSVVTEVHFFRGALETLARLRWSSPLPLLRKDFVVDSYQVLESRHAGADALLLITALLGQKALTRLRELGESFGMDALVEVHNEDELHRALDSGAKFIGVNNRNLRTFEVSLDTSLRLAPLIPSDVVAVAESGIRSRADIDRLASAGYRAFLIGETLLRASSPGDALREMTALAARRGHA